MAKHNKTSVGVGKPTGISTKGARSQNSRSGSILPQDDVIGKKKLDAKGITLIVTAAVLLAVIIASVVFFAVEAYNADAGFDYLGSRIENYVSFSESDYKDYSLKIDIAKPHEKKEDGTGVSDVEVAILSMIATEIGNEDPLFNGSLKSNLTITPADAVYIWYRGYILDDEGKQVEITGMSNFGSELSTVTSSSNALVIGSGKFVPGFELGLVGKDPTKYPRFTKITEGNVTSNHVVYLDYTRVPEGGDATKDKETGTAARIDLTDPGVYEKWGAILNGKVIGGTYSFTNTVGGKTYNYTDTKISFVTECETNESFAPILVECYFPYDYSVSNLRNETAYFEVYVEKVQAYNPWHNDDSVTEYDISYDWNDEFVRKRVAKSDSAITLEDLEKYEGATLTAKYEAYAKEYLWNAYEDIYRSMIEEQMWNYYLGKAQIKRYPGVKVDEIYREYYDDVIYQFENAGGEEGATIYNEYTFTNETYYTVDEYAIVYLGLQYSANQNWQSVLYEMSQTLVAERLILYYLMKVENLMPTDDVFNARMEKVKQEYVDEYIAQYLAKYEKDRDDYTDEEYEEFVEKRKEELFGFYDDAYFAETTYYEIVLDTLITYPKVSTFDDRRAYVTPEES